MARGGIGAATGGIRLGGRMEFARARRRNALLRGLPRDSAIPVSAAARRPEAQAPAAHRAAARSSAGASPRAALPPGFDRFGGGCCGRRCGANRAQIAFDHRQAIDHMAERIVDGLQRFLGAAVGFRLAETDVGQFALDGIDDVGVHRLRRAVAAAVCRRSRPNWRAAARDGAECPAARPRRGRDCRRRDCSSSRAVPKDTTRAVRDGRTPTRCRCRPGCGRGARTGCAARPRSIPNCRRLPAARAFRSTRSARQCAVRDWQAIPGCRSRGTIDRPWPTAHARLRKAATARRWRQRWRRSNEAPRSRLRAGARSRDRRSNAGSGRAWRRDCGSHRHSR